MPGLPIAERLFARRGPQFFPGERRLDPALLTRSWWVEPHQRPPIYWSANWAPVARSALPSEFVFSVSQRRAFPRKFSGLAKRARLACPFARRELCFF